MKKGILVVGGIFMMMAVFITPARADFKEGKWAMTMVTKMDTSNMPPQMAAMLGNPMTITNTACVTHQNPVPKQHSGCQGTHQINGDTVTFNATCSSGSAVINSSGTFTYQGDSMNGHIQTSQSGGGRTINSTVDITGQYAGPC